ncbi:hypothetical protein ANCCAN_22305 [Ancylostoma caninum]|uniref:Uncharacterized protein n=1 Tax=Ancylostoma caninum TaxID=29170 RepID=A0A368FM77_ANCCA|nr:hypothetical protein ANCCAN_22305 [Ancylostoma caninum]
MHYNTLVFAETDGERKVRRSSGVQNKFCSSRRVLENLVEHSWRDQIVEAVLEEHLADYHVPLNEGHFVGGDSKDTLESIYELGD